VKSELSVTNPNEIEFTLTITMTLEEWRKLRDELGHRWPASDLASDIGDMIIKANQSFTPNHTP
jgi:hypothetical protein